MFGDEDKHNTHESNLKTSTQINNLMSNQQKIKYSQTCIKRSPLGQRKRYLMKQVTS